MRQRSSSITYDDQLLSPRFDPHASLTDRIHTRNGEEAEDDDKYRDVEYRNSCDTSEIKDLINQMGDGYQQRILKRRLSMVSSSQYSE